MKTAPLLSATKSATALWSQKTSNPNLSSLKVAVIGAGGAGLAAARVLTRNGIQSVTIFEKKPFGGSGLGGVWRYAEKANAPNDVLTNEKSTTDRTLPQPMYRSLRTNLPREIMRFREKSWGSNGVGKSFVTHKEVLSYLEEYANDYNLNPYIRYGCSVNELIIEKDQVSLASPSLDNDDVNHDEKPWPKITLRWEKQEETKDIHQSMHENNEEISSTPTTCHEDTYDVVCVCNGHYAVPSSPNIPGMQHFKGKIMHSVEYDDPSIYVNQTVLCIGGRASGIDIAREISKFARKVFLSDSAFPKEQRGVPIKNQNVTWVPRTQEIQNIAVDGNGGNDIQRVIFSDECTITPEDIDIIMFCSGYDYDFPFINEKSNLEFSALPEERRVGPLYKQIWHAHNPSLAFIGLQHSVVPFPLFEIQAEAITAQLTGSAPTGLPSKRERISSGEKDFKSKGPKNSRVKDTHYLGKFQWEYFRHISKMSDCYDENVENFIQTTKAIYEHSEKERKGMFPGSPDLYRETCYIRDDANQSFKVIASAIEKDRKVSSLKVQNIKL